MAGTFDVVPSELRTGAANLADDGSDLSSATSTVTGAIGAAAGGVPGGGLVGALGSLREVADERCAAMVDAVTGAGETLSSNAARYEHDDMVASGALDRAMLL